MHDCRNTEPWYSGHEDPELERTIRQKKQGDINNIEPTIFMVTFLTHGVAMEGGESGWLEAGGGGGGSVKQNVYRRGEGVNVWYSRVASQELLI